MKKKYFIWNTNVLMILTLLIVCISCKKSILDENPQDFFSSENAYTNAKTFQLSVNTLYADSRNFISGDIAGSGFYMRDYLRIGTDEATTGQTIRPGFLVDYNLFNSNHEAATYFWDKCYTTLIPRANTIIDRAELPAAVWTTGAEKNRIVAQAKFFRAYAYYTLVNLYGDIPLIERESITPQFNFTRTAKTSVLALVRKDLEFASQNLSFNPSQVSDGVLTSAAADMLLSTVYLAMKMPDSAVISTSRIINSGYYRLMTQRFGSDPNHSGHFPAGGGDAYSDLFWENNANRSGGNMESIWVLQNAFNVPGGAPVPSGTQGLSRSWGPFYQNLTAPDGKRAMIVSDSLGGRPVAFVRTTNYANNDIWSSGGNDMRNSKWNIRRDWYYNNPATSYYGQKIDFKAPGLVDTLYFIYPMFRKVEGVITNIGGSVTPNQKFIVYRLAEAYLLRAEAYTGLNQLQKAADDLNMVRTRSQASTVNAADVNIAYILDERARELIIEEPRRLTLNRLDLWYSRTLKYSLNEPKFFYQIAKTIQSYNSLFPIPRSAIDATPELKQNPGYN